MPPYKYSSIPDVEDGAKLAAGDGSRPPPKKEKSTYELTWAFKILSASVWASFSIWGCWIAVYYGSAGARRDWNAFNIVFPDLYSPEFSTAALGIGIHFFGAAFMAIAGVRSSTAGCLAGDSFPLRYNRTPCLTSFTLSWLPCIVLSTGQVHS
jgi:hypothetical protein